MTRSEAQQLADELPECDERFELCETVVGCDILLKILQSGAVTPEGIVEVRQAYEAWKTEKHAAALHPRGATATASHIWRLN